MRAGMGEGLSLSYEAESEKDNHRSIARLRRHRVPYVLQDAWSYI